MNCIPNLRATLGGLAGLAAAVLGTVTTQPAIAAGSVHVVGPAVVFRGNSVAPDAAPEGLDYAHAKPVPRPKAKLAPSAAPAGLTPTAPAGHSRAYIGTGGGLNPV